LYAGKKVFTNFKLLVPKKYQSQVTYLNKEVLNDIYEQIKSNKFNLKNSSVLVDEFQNYMDSRTSMSKKNRTFSYFILMSRHVGSDIIFTTQQISQVDIRVRRNTDFLIQPFILEKIDGVPSKVGLHWFGKVGQKWNKYYEEYDSTNIVNMYDTHEILDL